MLLCALYVRIARKANIVDTPNARSSHARATPLGGGLPMFLAFFAGLAIAFDSALWPFVFLFISGIAGCLVVLGVLDDLFTLSIKLRLVLYAAAALLASSALLGGQGALWGLPTELVVVCASLAVLWMLNLYNFMDGIDGIAAIQAALASGFIAFLAHASDPQYALFCALFGAAQLGFLVWNWPPARLFMGDAGSVPTGFLLACLVLLGATENAVNPASWMILLALFITDASGTLLWRVLSGQRFTQGHRSHAYQRLSRHWQSHLRVDAGLIIIFVAWLAPLAWAAQHWPAYSFVLVILAYLPWVIAMAKIRRLT